MVLCKSLLNACLLRYFVNSEFITISDGPVCEFGFLAGLAVLDYNNCMIRPTTCCQLVAP